MEWVMAWIRQLIGPPQTDPWEDDPRIRAERRGQHDRANKAGEGTYYEQQRRRERRIETTEDTWRRGDVWH